MLEIKNLSHAFGDKVIYKNINLRINKGDKIGLLGANGAGKSTLISILNGSLLCDEGEIVWSSKHKVGYLDQHATTDLDLTINEYLATAFCELIELENRFNQINESMATADEDELIRLADISGRLFDELNERNYYAMTSNINKVASGLGVTNFGIDTLMGSLSGGQRAKVMLVKLLLQEPDLIILDEPTNFLDAVHIDWLIKYLTDYKGTFLIVSHSVDFVRAVCNVIWDLNAGDITRYACGYDKYLEVKELQSVTAGASREKALKEADKLKDFIARNQARASTAKMAQSRMKKLDKLQITEIVKELPMPEIKFGIVPIDANVIMKVRDAVVGYGDKIIRKNISWILQNGDRLRICGFNGVGKTTLIKSVLGEIPLLGGSVKINPSVKVAYFEQDLKFADTSVTAITDFINDFPHLTEKIARTYLAHSGLVSKLLLEPIRILSGGEQSKIKLAKLMVRPSNLLILDEPTNHLDVKAKQALAKAINEYKGTVIFISHEDDWCQQIENVKVLNLN